MEKKIISARITAMPQSMFDPMPMVMITLEGEDKEQELFEFYPDEISFTANEFIGLTPSEGRTLKFNKDKNFLQN